MDRNQLPLEVSRQLGRLHAESGQPPAQIVAIILAFGSYPQVDQSRVAGDLDPDKAQVSGPFGQVIQGVERCSVSQELRQKYAGTLHAAHACTSRLLSRKLSWNSTAITAAAMAGYHHICCQSAI